MYLFAVCQCTSLIAGIIVWSQKAANPSLFQGQFRVYLMEMLECFGVSKLGWGRVAPHLVLD